jgi:uncharacterized protein (TIRG00374 family)
MRGRTKLIGKGLTAIVIGLFVYYFFNNIDSFRDLQKVALWPLIGIFAFKMLGILNAGQYLKANLLIFNKNISLRESFYVSLLSAIGNYFGPYLGGAGIRAVYLKKKFQLSYADFISTVSGIYLINFRIYSVAGVIALVLIHIFTGEYSLLFYLIFGVWAAIALFLSKLKIPGLGKRKLNWRGKITSFVLGKAKQIVNGWRQLRNNEEIYWKLHRISFINFLISFCVISLQFIAIGVEVSVPATVLYVAITNLSLYLSITPGAIGIREALFIFCGALLGLTTPQILQLAIVSRGMTFITMLIAFITVRLFKVQKITMANS